MNLLAIETATETCGAAVMIDGDIAADVHLHRPRVHAKRLTPLIEAVLETADVRRDELDVIAVSMGPGSYTGLRIGVSTAKGWALSVDAHLVGVPTLEAYAARIQPMVPPGDVICALLDARRDEVYAGAFRRTEAGLVVHADTTALSVGEVAEWVGRVDGRLWILGDGGEKSRQALASVGKARTVLSPDAVSPSATWVARRGRDRLGTQGPDDPASFEPLYAKEVHATPVPSPFA